MELPEDVIADVRKRLHRVVGQVQGVERMLDEGRECRDVVTQLSAAGLTYCLEHPDEAEADGYPIGEVQKMFMKLA